MAGDCVPHYLLVYHFLIIKQNIIHRIFNHKLLYFTNSFLSDKINDRSLYCWERIKNLPRFYSWSYAWFLSAARSHHSLLFTLSLSITLGMCCHGSPHLAARYFVLFAVVGVNAPPPAFSYVIPLSFFLFSRVALTSASFFLTCFTLWIRFCQG